MKKLVLAALGVLGLLVTLSRHRHARLEGKNEMFRWWTPDV